MFWPTTAAAAQIEHVVVHADGTRENIARCPRTEDRYCGVLAGDDSPSDATDFGPATRRPLGSVVAARSGDKGSKANVGVWTDTAERWDWLRAHRTAQRFAEPVSDARGFEIHRYEFPNLRALNFVIAGFPGEGVAACTRTDPQAKGLGEFLRAACTDIPDRLIAML